MAAEYTANECKAELEKEVTFLKNRLSKLEEELKDVASLSLAEGEAKLALKVYKGLKSKEECQQIVDYYPGNIKDMADLLSTEEVGKNADGGEPAVDSAANMPEDILEVAPLAQQL